MGSKQTSYSGVIDEVRLWTRARSASEIQSTIHRSLLGSEDDLVGYWTFETNVDGSVPSLVGYSNPAVFVGDANLDSSDARIWNMQETGRIAGKILWEDMEEGPRPSVLRYDGQQLHRLDERDGLPGVRVLSIAEDLDGNVWFATKGGVGRYDGERFTTFTAESWLGKIGHTWEAYPVYADRDGKMWFGSETNGVTAVDGDEFRNFTTDDGLAGNWVRGITQNKMGHLWFASAGGGVGRFDGQVFQSLTREDGLVNDMTTDVFEAQNGDIWITTEGGITRYRPSRVAPHIAITDVISDNRHGAVPEVRISASQDYLAFEFQGRSMSTHWSDLAYIYQLDGYDEQPNTTRDNRVEYADLPIGEHTFRVRAVDRDLNYSVEAAAVQVVVHPAYQQIVMIGGLVLALAGVGIASGRSVKRRRERDQARQQLVDELEQELQTARDMQMSLMPKESPSIEGLEVAARCIPATQVGGDFFQYFHHGDRLSISTADVTGHAMEAAVPVVMFEGVLTSQMRIGPDLESLFTALNDVMADRLTARTHVCFSMAQIDINTRAVRFANAGYPYPYHYHAATGDVSELTVSAYPLGCQAETVYDAIETQLEPGDRLVFCSDGIMEARNAEGEMYGFDQTAEIVRQGCQEGLSSEALLERILSDVRAFSGDHPQEDDQTIVVVGVES